jgi:hypothetical protein
MKVLVVAALCLSIMALLMVFVPGTPTNRQEAQREAELETIRHLTREYMDRWEGEALWSTPERKAVQQADVLPDGPPVESVPASPPPDYVPVPKIEHMVLQVQAREGRILRKLAPGGQVAEWAAKLESPPPWEDQHNMATLLHDYPVDLSVEDGLWLLERIRKRDWVPGWGQSLDEAIILHFTPERIAASCSPAELKALREEWAEDGYFDGW